MKRKVMSVLFYLMIVFSFVTIAGCDVIKEEVTDGETGTTKNDDSGSSSNNNNSSIETKDDFEEVEDQTFINDTKTIDDLITELVRSESSSGENINSSTNIVDHYAEGYVTSQETELVTEHFIVKLDANVYVPGYFENDLEIIYDTLEKVSGLSFYNVHYNSGKITIIVKKPSASENEFGSAFAQSVRPEITVSSGDLFLGNSYAITHELSHILEYSQSQWAYNRIYAEGFAEYTSYKALKYLERTNLDVALHISQSEAYYLNNSVRDDVFEKSIVYWMNNVSETFDFAPNGPYGIGFRLMEYLDLEYGDYSSWINYYENLVPRHTMRNTDQMAPMDKQIEAFNETYESTVLNKFYPWLKAHKNLFSLVTQKEYDLTSIKYAYIYPSFYYSGNSIDLRKIQKFRYNDLVFNIKETKKYLSEYKGKSITNLTLKLYNAVDVALYDNNGSLIRQVNGKNISISDASYIKLVGSGTLGEFFYKGLEITY